MHKKIQEDAPDGMSALQAAIQEQRWPQSMDASVWAKEWMKAITENPAIAMDETCMVGWFAHAIMAGYDTACFLIFNSGESDHAR